MAEAGIIQVDGGYYYDLNSKDKQFIKNFTFTSSSVTLVYGQMNESPGCRMRIAHAGLTVAEFFETFLNKMFWYFVDNVFRFLQAGSELSTLLGRMPSCSR